MPNIQVIDANGPRITYVLGDIHGQFKLLMRFLAILTNVDDVVFVGDLPDRGDQPEDNDGTPLKKREPENRDGNKDIGSLQVIREILARKNTNLGPKLHIARGNHEARVLETIDFIESSYINNFYSRTVDRKTVESFSQQLKSHTLKLTPAAPEQYWLMNLYAEEVITGKISFREDKKTSYKNGSEIRTIRNLFSQLPYIIQIKFNNNTSINRVVHAAMPINDYQLQKQLDNNNDLLYAEETNYAMWARKNGAADSPCIRSSDKVIEPLTITGHTPLICHDVDAANSRENSINLDTGGFISRVLLAYAIQTQTLLLIEDGQILKFRTRDEVLQYQALHRNDRDLFITANQMLKIMDHLASQKYYVALKKIVDRLDQHTYKLNGGGKKIAGRDKEYPTTAFDIIKLIQSTLEVTLTSDRYTELVQSIKDRLDKTIKREEQKIKDKKTPTVQWGETDQATLALYKRIYNLIEQELLPQSLSTTPAPFMPPPPRP